MSRRLATTVLVHPLTALKSLVSGKASAAHARHAHAPVPSVEHEADSAGHAAHCPPVCGQQWLEVGLSGFPVERASHDGLGDWAQHTGGPPEHIYGACGCEPQCAHPEPAAPPVATSEPDRQDAPPCLRHNRRRHRVRGERCLDTAAGILTGTDDDC